MTAPDTRFQFAPEPDAKPWWQSRTHWGVIISAAGKLAALAGYEIDAEAAMVLAMGAVSLVGDALAWYGRTKASRPIRPLRRRVETAQ